MNGNGSCKDRGDLIGYYSGGGAAVTDQSAAGPMQLAASSANNINFTAKTR